VANLSVACGRLAKPVVSRVTAMIASRANLPVDRLNDAVIVGETIASEIRPFVQDDRLPAVYGSSGSGFELSVGPLVAGGADCLRGRGSVPGAGNIFERLADEVRIEDGDRGEYLVLTFAGTSP